LAPGGWLYSSIYSDLYPENFGKYKAFVVIEGPDAHKETQVEQRRSVKGKKIKKPPVCGG
jgi:hypothetical protein